MATESIIPDATEKQGSNSNNSSGGTSSGNSTPSVSPTTAPATPKPTTAPATPKPTTAPSAPKPTTAPAVPKPTTAPAPTVKPTEKPSDPHAGKTYHEAVYKTVHHDAVYEDVWVVDQEAYSYEEPIYEERQITVCHVCGAEFDTSYSTKEFSAHDKAHQLAGEGSGYHSDVRKIQVGTRTVNVPEEGHWEKKLVKAAYDEKVLVRAAGWY